jgi:16S rRNA (cytidine1402-2'-O)-methyltransferase
MSALTRGERTGRLFVVATPIGNLGDASPRSIEVLQSVDTIAAEDTRRTRRLMAHFDVTGRLIAYHDHNEDDAAQGILDMIRAGADVALVSDAGTPLVADPGYRLVAACAESGIEIVAVPGPSALTAAISVAGLPPSPFYFGGYLPRKKGARLTRLGSLSELECTLAFYEAPHRIEAMLADLLEALGDRRAAVCREMTKVHEEVLRGPLSALLEIARKRKLRGEIVVLVEGRLRTRSG